MPEQHALSAPRVEPRPGPSRVATSARADGHTQGEAVVAAGEVVCILGLPFDAITLHDAVIRVREAIRARRRLFLSTPNLNFLIGAQANAAFRRSVIDSDLCVADGMPLVWMSRLLGSPVPERVAGSDLFARLRDDPLPAGHAPIRVYFFGGPAGAAEAAAARLNAGTSGMVCVGFEAPGFGTVEDMSGDDALDRINASRADFLVVALGAAKGQAWIQRNRGRLRVPVISHLGAVVNFEAGTVSRAPGWMQRTGLEWLWRIKEEPALWKRYGLDARAFLGLFAGKLLPHALWLRANRPSRAGAPAEADVRHDGHGVRLCVRGVIPDAIPDVVRAALQACEQRAGPVSLDLAGVGNFGPGFAACLLRFEKTLAEGGRPLRLADASRTARRLLRWNGIDTLFAGDEMMPARQG